MQRKRKRERGGARGVEGQADEAVLIRVEWPDRGSLYSAVSAKPY